MKKTLKKRISCCLIGLACLIQPLTCLQTLAEESTDYDLADAVHLSSPQDLIELSRNCILDTWSQGRIVVLDCDIDMNGQDFSPVPTFGGIFLGQDHTISGLSLEGGSDHTGFFRYIQETGEICDLRLSGNIQSESAQKGLSLFAGCNRGLISGCTASGSATGGDNVGMLAGTNELTGVITDCVSEGFVYGRHRVGGIAGVNKGSILNCRSRCRVNTTVSETDLNLSTLTLQNLFTTENAASVTDIGGIAGSNPGIIRTCVNDGSVGYQHVGYNIGGIAGSQMGYIEGSVNYGVLNGRKDVGGIVGQMEPSSEFEFSEDTLARLHTEFDRLHELVTQLLRDAGNTSDSLTGQADSLLSSVEDIQRALEEITGNASADLENFSRLSDLSVLPAPDPISLDFLDKLPTPSASSTPTPSEIPEISPTPDQTPQVSPTPDQTPQVSPTPDQTPQVSPTPDEVPGALPEITAERGSYIPKKRMTQPEPILPSELPDPMPTESVPTAEPLPTEGASTTEPAPTENVPVESPQPPESSPSESPSLPIPLPSIIPELPIPSGFEIEFDREAAEQEINRVQDGLYEDASAVLEKLADLLSSRTLAMSARLACAQQSLGGSFSGFVSNMRLLNSMIREENQTLVNDFQAISDQMNVIATIVTQPDTPDSDEIIMDVSDQDEDFDTTGKVMNCANKGKIYGDLNVGGIAGSLSRENNLDPEDDLDLDLEQSTFNFRYKERIVIRKSQNSGVVTGKKDCVGGIAGNMALGSIIDCIGNGDISSDGSMVGGIAGSSQAGIRGCSAKCALSGKNQIGGIAGCAKSISDCYSMVEITEGGNYLGSIAGTAQSLDDVRHNYFVAGGPAGIDGVSYTEAACPLSYGEFMALEGLPDIYRNICLTFMADDRITSTVTLSYGESFDVNKLPPVPEKEGFSGRWEDFDSSSLTFDQTVNAIYREYVSTLESSQEENGRPLVLVEGAFTQEDHFTLTELSAYPEDGATRAKCHRLSLPQGTGPYVIRYLLPDDMKNPQIELLGDNTWTSADGTMDGSYYRFGTDRSELVFSCVDRPDTPSWLYALTAVSLLAAVCLFGFIILRKHRQRKTLR